MNYRLFHEDNVKAMEKLLNEGQSYDLIYSDMIYEFLDFHSWVDLSRQLLKPEGVFIVQTDFHSVAEMKVYLDQLYGKKNMISWAIFLNDWGAVPKRGFPNKHDDILIYGKGKNWKWYGERIQIPKATAGTAFDKKGTGMKTPPDVFYDHASFSTMAKERVKNKAGHNMPWQKPNWLMERLMLPFTDEGDNILDNFMGSGTLGKWCIRNNRNYVGMEYDNETFEGTAEALEKLYNDIYIQNNPVNIEKESEKEE